MFKVDNRHQNDIIDIFGRNMRGNIRSTKEKKTAKKKKNILQAQTPPRAAFYYKVVTYENEIAN